MPTCMDMAEWRHSRLSARHTCNQCQREMFQGHALMRVLFAARHGVFEPVDLHSSFLPQVHNAF